MSDDAEPQPRPFKPEGPPRIPGARAVRPKNAATVMIIRRDGPKPRVLMGKRHGGHSFMPDRWVFPGGRIDRADYRAPFATDLRPDVAATFDRHLPAARGGALRPPPAGRAGPRPGPGGDPRDLGGSRPAAGQDRAVAARRRALARVRGPGRPGRPRRPGRDRPRHHP